MLTVAYLIAMRGVESIRLKFYIIPKDKQQRKQWTTRIPNENLTKNAWVCSLHFVDVYKNYNEVLIIFPWTK